MSNSSATDRPSHGPENTAGEKIGPCNCKAEVNEHLAQYNTKLLNNLLDDRDIFVETIKIDEKKRGKPKYMFARYCPFCGTELKP